MEARFMATKKARTKRKSPASKKKTVARKRVAAKSTPRKTARNRYFPLSAGRHALFCLF